MRNGIIKYANGGRSWYQNDQLHREDGPAFEMADGTRSWWINGQLHREDGPAIEYFDGRCSWYLNDISYTQEDYEQELLARKWGLSVDA